MYSRYFFSPWYREFSIDKQYSFVYNTSGWKDQLVSIDISENVPCCSGSCYCWNTTSTHNSYNSIGNPTVHKGLYLSWSQGDKLTYYNGTSFTYASTGMRLTKGNNTTYEYEGDKLIKETRNGTTIEYLHGTNGITGFRYSGRDFYYVKNALGDVIAVVDWYGDVFAKYVYDAFGNCTITQDINGISTRNPIRYRSYYYDTETGLYYLNSRYYDPEIGRFISPADTSALNFKIINGLNLYNYANNNPNGVASNNLKTIENTSANLVTPNSILLSKNSSDNNYIIERLSTGLPSFFVVSPKKRALLDWGLSIHKETFYFDEAKNHSLYLGVLNISAFAGYNIEEKKAGIFLC